MQLTNIGAGREILFVGCANTGAFHRHYPGAEGLRFEGVSTVLVDPSSL